MSVTPDPPPPSAARSGSPAPLVGAAFLVGVEAMLLLLYGPAELFSMSGERLVMGITTAVFFMVYGAGLAFCAWAVIRFKSWARAPIVVAQLIQLLVAWSFRGEGTTPIAVALGLVAVLVLLGVFHPASIDALADESG